MYQDRPSSHEIAPHAASFLPRKEVIHPHVPVRIPCYDLTPIIPPTLGLREGNTSGIGDFHGLTGGVYKTRERIHGSIADLPLLAIPTSKRRVSASYPN